MISLNSMLHATTYNLLHTLQKVQHFRWYLGVILHTKNTTILITMSYTVCFFPFSLWRQSFSWPHTEKKNSSLVIPDYHRRTSIKSACRSSSGGSWWTNCSGVSLLPWRRLHKQNNNFMQLQAKILYRSRLSPVPARSLRGSNYAKNVIWAIRLFSHKHKHLSDNLLAI